MGSLKHAKLNVLPFPLAHNIYPTETGSGLYAEAHKAAFLRGEPFVDTRTNSRVSRYNFQPGDSIRITYREMSNVPALDLLQLQDLELSLTFSITFTIPQE